ncbi:MAG: oligopeptide transporter, OPT family, partial [Candidatus Hydrothermota bacterium]
LKGTLPWTLVFVGAQAAITVELLGVRSLPFAVGLYLPIELSATVLVGGLLSKIRRNESGILAASGLVAGDAIMGIVVAIFVASGAKTELLRALNLGDLGSALVFVILAWLFMRLIWRDKTEA